MSDQADKLRRLMQNQPLPQVRRRARVITITSGKGGVGKSNIAVNVTLALAQRGERVLLIDADFGMANVDVLLGQNGSYDISHFLQHQRPLADIITEGPYGARFLFGGSGIYEMANLEQDKLQYFMNQLAVLENWADIILIDTGAGLSRGVLQFVLAADEVVVVTTPEPTALTDAYALIKVYTVRQGSGRLHLVVNRATSEKEGYTAAEKIAQVAKRFLQQDVNVLGIVKEDEHVSRAVKQQCPLLIAFPNSQAARYITQIGNNLLAPLELPPSQGLRGFFHKIFHRIF